VEFFQDLKAIFVTTIRLFGTIPSRSQI